VADSEPVPSFRVPDQVADALRFACAI
jgi:hypothetical protein